MDGHRLAYVTGGKAHVVEYDNANPQTLQAALPHFPLFFSTDYQYVFNLQSNGPATALVSTPLRTVP